MGSATNILGTSSSSRAHCEAGGDFIKTTQKVASLHSVIESIETASCVVLQKPCQVFAKFMSEKGKLRIVPLLLGAAQIIGCVIPWKVTLNNKYKRIIFLKKSQVF